MNRFSWNHEHVEGSTSEDHGDPGWVLVCLAWWQAKFCSGLFFFFRWRQKTSPEVQITCMMHDQMAMMQSQTMWQWPRMHCTFLLLLSLKPLESALTDKKMCQWVDGIWGVLKCCDFQLFSPCFLLFYSSLLGGHLLLGHQKWGTGHLFSDGGSIMNKKSAWTHNDTFGSNSLTTTWSEDQRRRWGNTQTLVLKGQFV